MAVNTMKKGAMDFIQKPFQEDALVSLVERMLDQAKDAYEELSLYFRAFDPRHERAAAVFDKLGYIDVQFLAPRIRAEVLLYVGLMDAVCPPSTQFAAYNKITSKKDLVIYPDFAHESLPGEAERTFNFMLGL